jgi:hypothetical protein
LGGKIFEFPLNRFRDSWLARGAVDHLMHLIAWSRFGHVSESGWPKGGCHNYRPDVGSRSVFGNYEASFSVLRSVLMPAFSVFDADASYPFRLPIKPRPESYFGPIRLGGHLSLPLLLP